MKAFSNGTNSRLKVIVIYGGNSPEHDVSRTSALHIVKAIDLSIYETNLVAIDQSGLWYEFAHDLSSDEQSSYCDILPVAGSPINPIDYLTSFDTEKLVVFPALHGPNGEDGTIQGLLELFNIAYVGSKVLSSAICMDKIKCKELLSVSKLLQTKWTSIHKNSIEKLDVASVDLIGDLFIKPANMGSSIGVTKVTDRDNLKSALNEAAKYDEWLIIEEAVKGREIEVAILDNGELKASLPGEIIPGAEFYSYEDKYDDGAFLQIPANLTESEIAEVQDLALTAFKLLRCRGLARVDFFFDEIGHQWFINEINTMPGFTPISMYPKLWDATGISYPKLVNLLLQGPLNEIPME